MKAIIICAGEGTRWGDYLGVPKHLIVIEGETLIERSVRLLRENGVTDISVVVKEKDPRYEVEGSVQYIAKLNQEENADADKFLSSKELWNKEGRTIVFYGDCYFTEEAMKQIVSFDKREWTLFCRPNGSRITGAKWGECFAQSFYPEDLQRHEASLHYVAQLYLNKVITRCGGWEHYRAMVGKVMYGVEKPHVMTTNYVEIDDWTDDFDLPEDYEKWVFNRKRKLNKI